MRVSGRLAKTGRRAVRQFLLCQLRRARRYRLLLPAVGGTTQSAAPANAGEIPPVTGMRHADVCSPRPRARPRVGVPAATSPGAKLDDVKFGLAQLADMKIVEGNGVLTSSRQALNTLLIGIAAFTALQLSALLILVSLLFSAIVQERYREVGLLRAMGAKPVQVMTIILTEAAIITGLGGLAGLGFGAAVLLLFARSLGFYFALLGVPFSWPPRRCCRSAAPVAIVFSAVLGLPRRVCCRHGGCGEWRPMRSFTPKRR